VAENKEVADRNIGVPDPVRKYANYRTLEEAFFKIHKA
jgi:hypothetical protein